MGMGGDQSEPRPGPPPELTAPLDILRHLLAQNLLRLDVARRIEASRDFVFPEVTVIMRDCWRYAQEIERREAAADAESEPTPTQTTDLDDILAELD